MQFEYQVRILTQRNVRRAHRIQWGVRAGEGTLEAVHAYGHTSHTPGSLRGWRRVDRKVIGCRGHGHMHGLTSRELCSRWDLGIHRLVAWMRLQEPRIEIRPVVLWGGRRST